MGERDTDYHDQLGHFNRIIEELFDLRSQTYNLNSGLSAEIYLARYISVINTGKFPKTFIPKALRSVYKSRRQYIKKYGTEDKTLNEIDLINMQKDL